MVREFKNEVIRRIACSRRRARTKGMNASLTDEKGRARRAGIGAIMRGQMRNIAPFLTLICLVAFFGFASPSFTTLDNLGNILTQVSVTGIIAVGLTFVILCAEIDLSIASVANATGIVVAYFTAQESYVNIANLPLPGAAAIVLALAACLGAWPRQRARHHPHRHSLLHHDARHDADRRPASRRSSCAARSPTRCPISSRPWARARSAAYPGSWWSPRRFCSSAISCSPTRALAATFTSSAATARRPNIRASTSS